MMINEVVLTQSYTAMDVGQWNNLFVRGNTASNFRLGDTVLEAPSDLLQYSTYLKYAFNDAVGKLLMTNWAGDHVYVLDLISRTLANVLQLARADDDDLGLYTLSLHPLTNSIAIVYESGLAVFSKEFDLRWQDTFQHPYDWVFDRVENETIWYYDHMGVAQGYTELDGRKING